MLVFFKGGEIKFEDVNFGYYEDWLIFWNLSFIIFVGKKVVVVGLFGCGKLMLFRLLFCSYDV